MYYISAFCTIFLPQCRNFDHCHEAFIVYFCPGVRILSQFATLEWRFCQNLLPWGREFVPMKSWNAQRMLKGWGLHCILLFHVIFCNIKNLHPTSYLLQWLLIELTIFFSFFFLTTHGSSVITTLTRHQRYSWTSPLTSL